MRIRCQAIPEAEPYLMLPHTVSVSEGAQPPLSISATSLLRDKPASSSGDRARHRDRLARRLLFVPRMLFRSVPVPFRFRSVPEFRSACRRFPFPFWARALEVPTFPVEAEIFDRVWVVPHDFLEKRAHQPHTSIRPLTLPLSRPWPGGGEVIIGRG